MKRETSENMRFPFFIFCVFLSVFGFSQNFIGGYNLAYDPTAPKDIRKGIWWGVQHAFKNNKLGFYYTRSTASNYAPIPYQKRYLHHYNAHDQLNIDFGIDVLPKYKFNIFIGPNVGLSVVTQQAPQEIATVTYHIGGMVHLESPRFIYDRFSISLRYDYSHLPQIKNEPQFVILNAGHMHVFKLGLNYYLRNPKIEKTEED